MLDGKAWQKGGARPFGGLNKHELQSELQTRVQNHTLTRPSFAPHITTIDKADLQEEFKEVKKGFCNFPALVTSNLNANLQVLHLGQYEVAPTEPLHDFKGHMANIIAEVRANTRKHTLGGGKSLHSNIKEGHYSRCGLQEGNNSSYI